MSYEQIRSHLEHELTQLNQDILDNLYSPPEVLEEIVKNRNNVQDMLDSLEAGPLEHEEIY